MLENELVMEHPLQDLFVSGCCVDLTIRTWQAKTNAKSFFDELDIKDTHWNQKFLTGGQMKFVDDDIRKSFHQYEVRARVWLDQNSFPFMNVKFVPFNAMEVLMDGNEYHDGLIVMRKEFDGAVNEFLNKFEDIRSSYIDKMSKVDEKYRKLLERSYPTKEEVQNKFEFDWVCFEPKVPQIFDDKQESTLRKDLDDKSAKFIEDSKKLLRDKILTAIWKFQRVVDSTNTVKSSSINAMKKAVGNFQVLNFTEDTFIEQLHKISKIICDIENIDGDDVDTKKKVSSVLSEVLNNVKQ